jgi:hypothetical protein
MTMLRRVSQNFKLRSDLGKVFPNGISGIIWLTQRIKNILNMGKYEKK